MISNESFSNEQSQLVDIMTRYYNSLIDYLVVETIKSFTMFLIITICYVIIGLVILRFKWYLSILIMVLGLLCIFILIKVHTANYRINKIYHNDTKILLGKINKKYIDFLGNYIIVVNNKKIRTDSFIYNNCKCKENLMFFTRNNKVLGCFTLNFINLSEYRDSIGSVRIKLGDFIEYYKLYYELVKESIVKML